MTKLIVTVLGAKPSPQTAAPGITLRLRIEELRGGAVLAVALRCETRIEPRGRRFTPEEHARLYELFGEPSQWHRTLQAVTWTHSTILVPSFTRQLDVDLTLSCTYDLEVASAKYLHAIRDGEIPLLLLFSGSIFNVVDGALSVEPVPWDLEASYRLPSDVWRATMDQFFPGGGWIRLQTTTLDRLQAFRGTNAVVSWDEAIELLLRHTAAEMA